MNNPAHHSEPGSADKKPQQSNQKPAKPDHLKYREILVVVTTITVSLVIIIFGSSLSYRMSDIEKQWLAYDKEIAAANYALERIKDSFGYGGFIHNFKNYQLRKEVSLVERIKNDLTDTYQAIDDFKSYVHQPEIISELMRVKKVVDEYAGKFEIAQELVKKNKPAQYIDARVRVDDRPAIEALHLMSRHILQHRNNQAEKTSRSLNEVLGLLSWGVLIVPLVLVTAIVIIFNIRHNHKINLKLEETRDYMMDLFDAAPDAILMIDKKGRIIESNRAAKELLLYDKEQFFSLSVEDLIPERFRKGHSTIRENSFESPVKRSLNTQSEFYALRQDGKEIPVDISINYTSSQGEAKAITILRDVSVQKEIENNLIHSENVLKKAQSIAHFGSWEWNIKTGELSWSDQIFSIFGINKDQFGASYDRFVGGIHPDDRENVVNAVNETVVFDKPYSIEHRIVRPDGETRYVNERGDVYRNEAGEAEYMVGTIIDITDQKKAARELMLADNVFSHTAEAILVSDADNKILRVNQAFTEITGYTEADAKGKTPGMLLKSGEHDYSFYKSMWQDLCENGDWQGEIIDRRKDGTTFPSWHNISVVKDEQGDIVQFTSIFSDITEKKASEERIKNLAQFDQLTQLPNRMLFNDRLQHAITRSKRSKDLMGLLFIDLDGFKAVNDTFGHQAGDILLQQVGERLSDCVREQDTVARLGGDEFTIILECLSHVEDAALVANKVLKSLSKEIIVGENKANIGASIGISIFPDDGINADLLIKRADTAMYHAKKNGKHQYQYYEADLEAE